MFNNMLLKSETLDNVSHDLAQIMIIYYFLGDWGSDWASLETISYNW